MKMECKGANSALQQARRQAGYRSARDFAVAVGATASDWARWENVGRDGEPAARRDMPEGIACRAAELLGIPVSEVTGSDDEAKPAVDYSKVTKQGYQILDSFEREDGQTDVLAFKHLDRGNAEFVIGHGYDIETGSWSQGLYCNDLPTAEWNSVRGVGQPWWRKVVETMPIGCDMEMLPNDAIVVALPDGYVVAQCDDVTGIAMELYDKSGNFASDLAYFSQEPDFEKGEMGDYVLHVANLKEPAGANLHEAVRVSGEDLRHIGGAALDDELHGEIAKQVSDSETAALTDRAARLSGDPAAHDRYLADCAEYVGMIDNEIDAEGTVFAVEEHEVGDIHGHAKYRILGGSRSLSDLIQSLDCKNGVSLFANAGTGAIVVDVHGASPHETMELTLRELASSEARDRAMTALDDAPNADAEREEAKSLFEDAAGHGAAVARALVERRELKAGAGSTYEVDVTAVMFDGPRFMIYLPQGTDAYDWKGKDGALEALKKALHKAVDEADLGVFDVCETFEDVVPASEVTYLA